VQLLMLAAWVLLMPLQRAWQQAQQSLARLLSLAVLLFHQPVQRERRQVPLQQAAGRRKPEQQVQQQQQQLGMQQQQQQQQQMQTMQWKVA
jgi:hypothetical protein